MIHSFFNFPFLKSDAALLAMSSSFPEATSFSNCLSHSDASNSSNHDRNSLSCTLGKPATSFFICWTNIITSLHFTSPHLTFFLPYHWIELLRVFCIYFSALSEKRLFLFPFSIDHAVIDNIVISIARRRSYFFRYSHFWNCF